MSDNKKIVTLPDGWVVQEKVEASGGGPGSANATTPQWQHVSRSYPPTRGGKEGGSGVVCKISKQPRMHHQKPPTEIIDVDAIPDNPT